MIYPGVNYAPMTEQAALEGNDIHHRYGEQTVLDDVNLRLERGRILGLLGPNGAGKSTLLDILAGITTPTAGAVHIGVRPLTAGSTGLRRIGYLPATPPLHDELTVREQLRYAARLQRLDDAGRRIDEVAARCAIGDVDGQYIGRLSKGYRQRVGLAQALLHAPDILLLDEPGDGLDPIQSDAFHALLRALRDDDTAILLSSHNLAEVKALCDDIAIIDRGRLLLFDRLDALREPLETLFTRLVYGDGNG